MNSDAYVILFVEPRGSVGPKIVAEVVETRKARVGESIAALCSVQASPSPSFRLIFHEVFILTFTFPCIY